MSKAISDAVEAHWGERCKEFDPDCDCCKAWAEYDRLMQAGADRDEARAGYAALDRNWCTLHDMMGNAIRRALNLPGASVSELVEAIENLKGRQ